MFFPDCQSSTPVVDQRCSRLNTRRIIGCADPLDAKALAEVDVGNGQAAYREQLLAKSASAIPLSPDEDLIADSASAKEINRDGCSSQQIYHIADLAGSPRKPPDSAIRLLLAGSLVRLFLQDPPRP